MQALGPKSIILLVLFCGYLEAMDTPGKLLPVDEIPRCAGAAAFRSDLIDAVTRRDVYTIRSILVPEIKLSFGGDDGIAAFEALWNLEAPGSRFWDTMGSLLAGGGSVGPDCLSFTAPYVFTEWPSEYDAFGDAAILGKGVRLRSAPSLSAPVLKALSYDIVHLRASDESHSGWARVETLEGAKGDVSKRYLRSQIDYRAFFEYREGSWRLTTFVAGD